MLHLLLYLPSFRYAYRQFLEQTVDTIDQGFVHLTSDRCVPTRHLLISNCAFLDSYALYDLSNAV